MNALKIKHLLPLQKDTITYANKDAETSKPIHTFLIASSMDELNIRVNDKFDLLSIIDQGGIICLKLDDMLFMSEESAQELNTRNFKNHKEGSSKTVGDNIEQLMLQFLACRMLLSEVNNLPIEAAAYLLEYITKCLVE